MTGAFGADKIITSANTCTVDVLGVSDNNAVANTIATWDLIDYTLNPGQYLNVTETSVDKTICPAGSYCVGGGFTVETPANSIAQCQTGYPNSANGAPADTQCYTACTVATANIAHATAVGGNDYFGDGADACYATACETGYHVDGGGIELVEKTPLIPVDYMRFGRGYGYINADGSDKYADTKYNITSNNTWATEFAEGVVYGKASCQPKADAGNEYLYQFMISNKEAFDSRNLTMEEFVKKLHTGLVSAVGATRADVYMLRLMDGPFEEIAKYWAIGIADNANYSTNSVGQYCYCQVDGFSPITDGTSGEKTNVTSAPWVFYSAEYNSADDCASRCAQDCAYDVRDGDTSDAALRAVMFGALEAVETGGICAANTINIDWNPDNGGEHTKNMCTYDGSITVPADPVKPGYTFTGWKLVD